MNKTISYKGKLPIGTQERINLATIKGKIGYRIKKFEIVSTEPGSSTAQELIGRIFTDNRTTNTSPTVDFTDDTMLATALTFHSGNTNPTFQTVIFDTEMTNQDVFVSIIDAAGATIECNYYIELESSDLSDIESTMLTLKNLRTLTSV